MEEFTTLDELENQCSRLDTLRYLWERINLVQNEYYCPFSLSMTISPKNILSFSLTSTILMSYSHILGHALLCSHLPTSHAIISLPPLLSSLKDTLFWSFRSLLTSSFLGGESCSLPSSSSPPYYHSSNLYSSSSYVSRPNMST